MTHAREILDPAVRTLAATLEDAEKGSPNDPGRLSRITRVFNSFGAGVGVGV